MADRDTLRSGASGDEVTSLQNMLLQFGHDQVGTADGVFGANTDAAVRAFQEAHGIAVDGIVGPQTWEALDKASGFGGTVL